MVKLQLLMFALSCLMACRQPAIKGVVIDPSISKTAKEHFTAIPRRDSVQDGMLVYSNAICVKFYQGDTLFIADTSFSNTQRFRSFYAWKGDTLEIQGLFGLFSGGSGFAIHLRKEEATPYYLVVNNMFKLLAYQPSDSLTDIILVPCTNASIVLSEVPDSNKKQQIYGYVALTSNSYYHATEEDGKEQLPRSKQRVEMRVYFKSSFLKL